MHSFSRYFKKIGKKIIRSTGFFKTFGKNAYFFQDYLKNKVKMLKSLWIFQNIGKNAYSQLNIS